MAFLRGKIFKKTESKPADGAEKRSSGVSLQNPKILEVNLIKDEARVAFDWQRNFLILGIVLGLAALLVGETYWILDRWEEQENSRLNPLIAETDRLNAEVARLRNESAPALSYQSKSEAFSEILGNHIYWSGVFDWLEKNTLSSVRYEGFAGDLTGIYELKANADSFADASWQAKQLLSDPAVESATIRSVESNSGKEGGVGVSFTIEMKLKPAIFKK